MSSTPGRHLTSFSWFATNAKTSERGRLMTEKLGALGLDLSWERVLTFAKIEAQGIDLPMPTCKVDLLLNEGDVIEVGNLKLAVWHTPGHTAGQLSFKLNNLLFCGDNIYKHSCVGVIDAHHGSHIPDFLTSLRRILNDDSEFLLPSHGRSSAGTIASSNGRSTG